jgi:acetyl-CoA carboxylase carboxyl transferase subunit alpha
VVERARHPQRPYAADIAERIFDDMFELSGDRLSGDDPALRGGLALLGGATVAVLMQQKGRTQSERIHRNFGMPHPEGYRKATRVMQHAERLGIPVVCFVDTPGAYPGVGAEERGQAWAIATCLSALLQLRTPSVSVILGEGGSGGALALAATDRVLMLEHSIYSVASPEACASIVFRDSGQRQRAAAALRLTAQDALTCGLADRILPEPGDGAHESPELVAALIRDAVCDELRELTALSTADLLGRRRRRYRELGRLG